MHLPITILNYYMILLLFHFIIIWSRDVILFIICQVLFITCVRGWVRRSLCLIVDVLNLFWLILVWKGCFLKIRMECALCLDFHLLSEICSCLVILGLFDFRRFKFVIVGILLLLNRREIIIVEFLVSFFPFF